MHHDSERWKPELQPYITLYRKLEGGRNGAMDTLAHKDTENPSSDLVISMICFGTWISLILYGQYAREVYTYFCRYPKDGYDLKAIIGALCVASVVHVGSLIHVNYSAIILYGSSYPALGAKVVELWSFYLLLATDSLTLLITHFFFARRLYKLGLRTLLFVLFVGIMLLAVLVVTVSFMTYQFLKHTAPFLAAIAIIINLSISFLLDVVIVVNIVGYLRRCRTGLRSTDNILNKLTSFSVNTGLLTGILTLIPIIILAPNWAASKDFVSYLVGAMVGPVHASVVVAAVNSRRSLVDHGSEGIELRSFDLDVSPQPMPSSTIQWADAERSCSISGSDPSQGTAQMI